METPDVYRYDDFRLFLRDCYDAKKRDVPGYSCRKFAAEAGIANPGYLNDVIKGSRQLSSSALGQVIRVFGLKPQEAEFFQLLVRFGRAKKSEDRDMLYRQILFRRSRSSFTRMNPALVKYYQDLHYPLVRSAVDVVGFRGDYEEFSRWFEPSLPTLLLKKIVRDLCEWGLLQVDATGRYSATSKLVEPPPAMLSNLVRQMNREWIGQGREAISRFAPEDRHISTILLSVSEATRREVSRRIEAFRREIFRLIEEDPRPEVLMQLSMQYFPRTKTKGKP